jgi:2,4-dienoyl-CoA reductase-like NADH-dependent reductase (Old Yellow Enzyme family)
MTLFDQVRLGACELRNRIVMAPMSQHRAGEDGLPTDWGCSWRTRAGRPFATHAVEIHAVEIHARR